MDFMAHFTMGTGGHYITMLPADWSISTSHDTLPSSCHSENMLWNPYISAYIALFKVMRLNCLGWNYGCADRDILASRKNYRATKTSSDAPDKIYRERMVTYLETCKIRMGWVATLPQSHIPSWEKPGTL